MVAPAVHLKHKCNKHHTLAMTKKQLYFDQPDKNSLLEETDKFAAGAADRLHIRQTQQNNLFGLYFLDDIDHWDRAGGMQ